MPSGTCKICGCTDEHACPNGCTWLWPDRQHCSQCVAWVLIKLPSPFEGIMPYNLWPVRTLEAVPVGGKLGNVWPLDVRRLTREQLERAAYIVATSTGATVDEFLELVGSGDHPFPIRHNVIARAVIAPDVDRAAALIAEFDATGRIKGGLSVQMTREGSFSHEPASTGQPGGTRRG